MAIKNKYMVMVEVSNKHVHLSKEHLDVLFGKGYELNPKYYLSQPGEFAAEEIIDLVHNDRKIESVRVVGPLRPKSQVELLESQCHYLYDKPAPVKISGDHEGSFGVRLVGPKGSVNLSQGVIISRAHIHLSKFDSEHFNLKTNDKVDLYINDSCLQSVVVRVGDRFRTSVHIDKEQANMMGVEGVGTVGFIYVFS